jgi:hypothetical protein
VGKTFTAIIEKEKMNQIKIFKKFQTTLGLVLLLEIEDSQFIEVGMCFSNDNSMFIVKGITFESSDDSNANKKVISCLVETLDKLEIGDIFFDNIH